jgi:4-hydroxybenzoate polyprenyltransferase
MLYLAGMALNDYADREVDAEERPNRPIPSGRVPAKTALGIGMGLMAAGIATAAAVDGRRGARKASALAGMVCLYDFATKNTSISPLVMGACRTLDVLSGADSACRALPAATVIGAHTVAITSVSRFEAQGGPASVGRAALVASGAVSVAALAVNVGTIRRSPIAAVVSAASIATYAIPFAGAAREAMANPEPRQLQKVVGTGVMGMIPLQGALISGAGRTATGSLVTALWPLAQRFRRKAT